MMGQKIFWDKEKLRDDLNQFKPLLPNLNQIIPWENFRATLEDIYPKARKSNAGRKHYDVILMFKLLILQQLYNIRDVRVAVRSTWNWNIRLKFFLFYEILRI